MQLLIGSSLAGPIQLEDGKTISRKGATIDEFHQLLMKDKLDFTDYTDIYILLGTVELLDVPITEMADLRIVPKSAPLIH